MKIKRIALWVAMLGVSSMAATAVAQTLEANQPSESALSKVVEKTILTNPEVRARYYDFTSSLEGQNVARGGWRPQVTAQGWTGREWLSGGDTTTLPGDWQRTGWSLQLRQLIFDGFATSNSISQLGFEKLSSYYELLSTTDSLADQAIEAYLDVQRYREREVLARDNFSIHQVTLRQLRERQQSGVGRRVDLEQANGRLSLAQTNLMTESNNLNDVTQRYRRIVGEYPTATLADVAPVSDKLPVPESAQNFESSLQSNPSILSKQALVQAAESGMKVAKAAHSPTLELVAATGRDRNDPTSASNDAQSSRVQLLLTYNLYRGGADEARRRQTVAQHSVARDVRDYTCRNVQQDLSVAWDNVIRLRQQIPFLREHEISTAKVRTAYQQQFQIGQRSLLDLLDTENELFNARLALIDAQYDLRKAEFKWLTLSGQLLPALQLAQPHGDSQPDERRELALSQDVLHACLTPLPDTSNLKPVVAVYGNGDEPPVLQEKKAP